MSLESYLTPLKTTVARSCLVMKSVRLKITGKNRG